MRLPRKCSICKQADFARIRKTGRSKAGRFLILSTLNDDALDHVNAAVVTSRKAGKAHERVLLRRRFRVLLQKHADQLINPSCFIVCIALKDAKHASFEALEEDWLRCAKRLKLIEKHS